MSCLCSTTAFRANPLQKPPWIYLQNTTVVPQSIESILDKISEREIMTKQAAFQSMAHRAVLQLDDGEEDALEIMLRRTMHDAMQANLDNITGNI